MGRSKRMRFWIIAGFVVVAGGLFNCAGLGR